MKNPVSLFIMDITESSSFNDRKALSQTLIDLQNLLLDMNECLKIKAKLRLGDEIICICEDYYSAYVLACYILFNWKYRDHRPYFGITMGDIDEDIDTLDIDIWNHPIVKDARIVSEELKANKNRSQLIKIKGSVIECDLEQLDLFLQLQSDLIINQTENQREVTALYLIFESQKQIQKHLKKAASTISNQYKNGKTDLIIKIYKYIVKMLQQKQQARFAESPSDIDKKYKKVKTHLDQLILNRLNQS